MTKRRSKGDGSVHWHEGRQRWIAEITVGYDARGRRKTRSASGKTKTEAKTELRRLLREKEDGQSTTPDGFTVADAVEYWLAYGLSGKSKNTLSNYCCLVESHILPHLGRKQLRGRQRDNVLSAEDVDRFLADRAAVLSTRTLRLLHSMLNRAIKYAQARDKADRNVVALCDIPTGQEGRPSKALNMEQAEAVLKAAKNSPLHAYIVLSLLVGARPEELRALTWDHVDLHGDPEAVPAIPRSIQVWHSVREGGDTKTSKSRRTLALPMRCVVALRLHRIRQTAVKKAAGARWQEHNLVFASTVGTELDPHNVRRAFRKVIDAAGLPSEQWTPREMRHSFVSLLSDSGVSLEDIARLVGHNGTRVTELVYRKQLRPVMVTGAVTMDTIFKTGRDH